MKCPFCLHTETKVVDSRETSSLEATRRRRECLDCEKRFTTYERIETVEVSVVKKDGRREPFSREKLFRGMLKACEKRPIRSERIDSAVKEIEADLRNRDAKEVSSRLVGELVMAQLKKLDDVAYVRFASVYRRFRDARQFAEE